MASGACLYTIDPLLVGGSRPQSPRSPPSASAIPTEKDDALVYGVKGKKAKMNELWPVVLLHYKKILLNKTILLYERNGYQHEQHGKDHG